MNKGEWKFSWTKAELKELFDKTRNATWYVDGIFERFQKTYGVDVLSCLWNPPPVTQLYLSRTITDDTKEEMITLNIVFDLKRHHPMDIDKMLVDNMPKICHNLVEYLKRVYNPPYKEESYGEIIKIYDVKKESPMMMIPKNYGEEETA